ncbi:MAG: hypothetical protein JWN25_3244 [Verrucomicrobiales bacterium]|nr:hypothetical protein [Verrucomicrobiales bacterium]
MLTILRGAVRCRATVFIFSCIAILSAPVHADTVVAANDAAGLISAVNAGGKITFTSGGTYTVPQTLFIRRDTIIDGSSGATVIRGSGSNRVFYVASGVRLTLLQLSVNNGKDQVGGGIYNAGTVYMSNCTMSANVAAGVDGFAGVAGSTNDFRNKNGQGGADGLSGYGGAIFNLGAVLGTNVTFANNSARGGVGGSGGAGGTNSTFGGNGGRGGNGGYAFGGAIFNSGSVLFSNASFSGNSAISGNGGTNGAAGPGAFPGIMGDGGQGGSAGGGAIFSSRSLKLYSSSLVGNSVVAGNTLGAAPNVNAKAGGLAVGGAVYNTGSLAFLNSTVAGNSATAGNGGNGAGGSFPRNGAKGGDVIGGGICNTYITSLSYCTVAANHLTNGTGGLGGSGAFTGKNGSNGSLLGANIANAAGYTIIDDTIVAYPQGGGGNVFGLVVDRGFNITSDLTGPLGAKSRRNLDPLLNNIATVSSNRTAIMSPKANSPARNRGNAAGAPSTDQIGQIRNLPDIGAAEYTLYFNISGSVTGPTQASGGVQIRVVRNTPTPTNSFAITASGNGPYTISGLLPGNYTLSVTNAELFPKQINVDIINSDIAGQNFSTNSVTDTNIINIVPVPTAAIAPRANGVWKKPTEAMQDSTGGNSESASNQEGLFVAVFTRFQQGLNRL